MVLGGRRCSCGGQAEEYGVGEGDHIGRAVAAYPKGARGAWFLLWRVCTCSRARSHGFVVGETSVYPGWLLLCLSLSAGLRGLCGPTKEGGSRAPSPPPSALHLRAIDVVNGRGAWARPTRSV